MLFRSNKVLKESVFSDTLNSYISLITLVFGLHQDVIYYWFIFEEYFLSQKLEISY